MNPIFLNPEVKNLIWGSEQWGISAHTNGDDFILNKEYKGLRLSDLWKSHPELFGNTKGDRFPLLTKIIDAKKDLSIQVHPDDEYAAKNENGSLGKTECWYIMTCRRKPWRKRLSTFRNPVIMSIPLRQTVERQI